MLLVNGLSRSFANISVEHLIYRATSEGFHLLARGHYGSDPILMLGGVLAIFIMGAVVTAIGKTANPKSRKYSKHERGKEAADNFTMGLAVIVVACYFLYLIVKIGIWIFSLVFG